VEKTSLESLVKDHKIYIKKMHVTRHNEGNLINFIMTKMTL